jgi:hypothetical protein
MPPLLPLIALSILEGLLAPLRMLLMFWDGFAPWHEEQLAA